MEIDGRQILRYVETEPRFKGEVKAYLDSMKKLPNFDHSKFYSHFPEYALNILQGDVIKDLQFVSLPDPAVLSGKCMVLSNSCDIELKNKRMFTSRIIYAPLVKLATYKQRLEKAVIEGSSDRLYSPHQIEQHIDKIKKQKINQIFYLPEGKGLEEDAIIFFSSLSTNNNEAIPRDNLEETRMVSLSAYGWHIFLERLASFFTRLSDDTIQLRFTVT